MAIPAAPMVPKDGKLTITDNTTPTPLSWEVIYEDGDFKVGPFKKGKMKTVTFKDRGATYARRETEDEDETWSFTCHAVATTDASTGTPLDVARRKGAWLSAKSTLPDSAGGGASGAGAYTLTLTFSAERSDFGGTADASIVLKYTTFIVDEFSEGIPGKFSCSGENTNIASDATSVS